MPAPTVSAPTRTTPTGGARRNPYSLYQPQAKPAPLPSRPAAGNAPLVRQPRALTPRPTAAPRTAPLRRNMPAPNLGAPARPAPQLGAAPTAPRGGTLAVTRPRRPSRALAGLPPAVKTPPPGPVSRVALTRRIPAAPLRGPLAEQRVVSLTPQMHQRGVRQLTNWVRQENTGPILRGRPTHDWIGNPIPADARWIRPSSFTQINVNIVNITNVFGEPRHDFVFLPRTEFFPGFFDEDDGFFAFGHHRHHTLIFIALFFPFYFSQPDWYAFNYPGFYPSVYSMYGWSPGWVYPDRVYYQPAEYTYAPSPYRPGIFLDVAGQRRAIDDIREAWLRNDPGLFANHLTDQVDVRVYFNGAYSYTSSTNDFYAMTADTLSTAQTDSIDFSNPLWISSHEVFYTGYQVFNDPDGTQHELYLSYRLRKLGLDWYIVGFGTSTSPIRSHYTDFRYR